MNDQEKQLLEEMDQLKKELKTTRGVMEKASDREMETKLKLQKIERINSQNERTIEEQKNIIQKQHTMIHKLQDEKQLLSDQRLCKICYNEELQVLPIPCGHLTSCRSCARKTLQCPVC